MLYYVMFGWSSCSKFKVNDLKLQLIIIYSMQVQYKGIALTIWFH